MVRELYQQKKLYKGKKDIKGNEYIKLFDLCSRQTVG